MKPKAVLLLALLVFAFTLVIMVPTVFIASTINAISVAKATGDNVVFEIQPTGDPIDDPVGPGMW